MFTLPYPFREQNKRLPWMQLSIAHFAIIVWQICYNWIGVQQVQHCELFQHYFMHNCFWLGKRKTILWRAVWCSTTWSLWCHRNRIIFYGEKLDFYSRVEQIRFKAWSWLSAKVKNFNHSFYDWYVSPMFLY